MMTITLTKLLKGVKVIYPSDDLQDRSSIKLIYLQYDVPRIRYTDNLTDSSDVVYHACYKSPNRLVRILLGKEYSISYFKADIKW